jgi:two-component system cell cycle response regulator
MIDKQIKVLLIEDNPTDARMIQKMVEEKSWASFDLTCVAKLQAGLKRLVNGGADIVLLDLDLPDSKGLGTFLKVHAQESAVPIVVLTGLDDEKIGLEAVQKGAQDYLVKGQVDGDLLIRAMRYAIGRQQAEEELRRSEEKNRSLLIAIPDIMFRLDKEGVFLEFITAKNFPLWMDASEFVGKNVQDVLDKKIGRRFMTCLKQAAKTGNTQILQYQLSVGGKTHHYEARIVATWGEEVLAIVRDFTDQRQAEKMAETDPLTNIYNRRKFSRVLDLEIQRVERYDRSLSIVLLDIDHFKRVNDTYGHDTGDYVLRRVTELIKDNIRITDILARYGGEEFVIILPETDVKGASRQIERMRKTIEKTSFDGVGNLTISAGIVGYMGGDSCKSMITRADKALYLAKEEGRNRVRIR